MDNTFFSDTSEPFDLFNDLFSYDFFKGNEDDPLKDPSFMEFLNSLATIEQEPTKSKKSTNTTALTRMGDCEHPKHIMYRQEKYTSSRTVPRRGRPPKGYLQTTIVKLTVRPLPKRLERVVGKSNIKVCLTCLKRSDVDPDYIKHQAYVGPQHVKK